jgi:hypothetical protein
MANKKVLVIYWAADHAQADKLEGMLLRYGYGTTLLNASELGQVVSRESWVHRYLRGTRRYLLGIPVKWGVLVILWSASAIEEGDFVRDALRSTRNCDKQVIWVELDGRHPSLPPPERWDQRISALIDKAYLALPVIRSIYSFLLPKINDKTISVLTEKEQWASTVANSIERLDLLLGSSFAGRDSDTLQPIQTGSVLWNIPDEMRVGERERIEIRVGDAKVAEAQLLAGLRGRGLPQIDTLEVSRLMRVTLVSDDKDFSVQALSNLDQYIREAQVARWDFDITPLRSGQRTLRILVSIRVRVEGKDELIDLPSYECDVHVRVAPFHTARLVCRKNWQWIASSIAIPLIVWVATKTNAGSALIKQLTGLH